MVLSKEQILKLVKAPAPPVLGEAQDLQADHKVHITGENYTGKLSQIIGYENVEQFNQKKLLTKPFTRPLLKYIIDAQSRWKTAQGTTKFYRFNKPENEANFRTEILSQVWKGGPMKDFINNFLSEAIYTEFNGFFVVDKGEIYKDDDGNYYENREGKTVQVEGDYEPKPYIIFKAASDIHNFSVTGEKVNWLIYELPSDDEGKKKYRVLDSKHDYIVYVEGDEVTIDEDIIEHKIGSTPVVPVTIINKELNNDRLRTSPIDALIPVLDYYLNQYAEHVVSCLLHAHPIYYQVGQKCTYREGANQCNEGDIFWDEKGEQKRKKCPHCKGTGTNIQKDASTVIIIPALTQQGDAFSINNVAGYVAPPVDILEHQVKELDAIKKEILEAATGQIGAGTLTERTATETILNLKPLEDIISGIIDVIEKIEKQLTDLIGKSYYGENYLGCEIIYGRRLNLRDENSILAEIKTAKENGASYVYIKTLFEELVYSRFSSSPTDLERNIILTNLEPFVGFSYKEIEESKNISNELKYLKQNFVDLLQEFEYENGDVVEYVKKTSSEKGKNLKEIFTKLKDAAKKALNENPQNNGGENGKGV